jgi:hypothetical protein
VHHGFHPCAHGRVPALIDENHLVTALPIPCPRVQEKGLDPTKFCKIRNACFASAPVGVASSSSSSSPAPQAKAPHLFLAQKIIQLTSFVTQEIDDWFEDPAATSDWLIKQQVRIILCSLMADDGLLCTSSGEGRYRQPVGLVT